MSTVIAETFSQPSKAYNIAHILFGYTFAFSLFSLQEFGNSLEYWIYVAIVGGFIGTFLYFLNPIEKALYLIFKKFQDISDSQHFGDITFSSMFSSPFLNENRGKINGGLYFFSSCLMLILFNSNFKNIDIYYVELLIFALIFMGIIVLLISIYEISKFGEKILIVGWYYQLIAFEAQLIVIKELRAALSLRDWNEAEIILGRPENIPDALRLAHKHYLLEQKKSKPKT